MNRRNFIQFVLAAAGALIPGYAADTLNRPPGPAKSAALKTFPGALPAPGASGNPLLILGHLPA